MKYEINIDRILQQLFILPFPDFHQIIKNRRNIYSFIHIHTNTNDRLGINKFK